MPTSRSTRALKGGVGKTVTVANLGAGLAERGLRALMVDFDPQADLSASWGLEEDDPRPRIEQFLGRVDGRLIDALLALTVDADGGRLALLPTAYEALRRQTVRLLDRGNRDRADLLKRPRDEFDVALIDTPAGDTVFGRQALVGRVGAR